MNQASQRAEDTFDGKIPDCGTREARSAFLNFHQDNLGSATTNLARNPKGFPSDYPVYFTDGRVRDILNSVVQKYVSSWDPERDAKCPPTTQDREYGIVSNRPFGDPPNRVRGREVGNIDLNK